MKMKQIKYSLDDNRVDKTKNEAIIFIHGAASCNQIWKNQIKGLSSQIKVIAVNLPSHFGSEGPESPIMETYVSAINNLIDSLKLEKVILAGHSMGGAVVLSYYLQYPQKVDGLILIGTGARLKVMPIILDLTQNNYSQFIEMSSEFAFHRKTIKNNKAIIEEVKKNMVQISSKIAYSDFKICNEFDVMDRLGEIQAPTLILVGDSDQLTPVKYSKYMHDHIQKSELYIIEDAGHMVMLEKGEQINKYIKEFIKKILN